ncbi:hypothetical protein QP786_06135, partial [Gleimia europaea]|nr:hypothetical protein [Gleimia europaea]
MAHEQRKRLTQYTNRYRLANMIDIPTGIAAEIRGEMGKRQISMKELANQTGMSYASIIRKINEGSRQLS